MFYGAMVAEGVIALIWAAAGVAFYNGTGGLLEALGNGQSSVVYEICFKLLGPVGAVIAMIGVIACPISSADTAYRSARLTLADWFKIDQKPIKNRLALTVPLLAVGAVLTQEILLLEQPDTGYDRPVGRKRISVPQKTFLLAHRPSGHLHVGCILHLYSHGKGRLPALHRHRLSCRHHLCCSVPGNLCVHLRDGQGKERRQSCG